MKNSLYIPSIFFFTLVTGLITGCANIEQKNNITLYEPTLIVIDQTAFPSTATLSVPDSPTPVPPSIANSYSIPNWLGDHNHMVIMAITSITDNSNQLTFFNVNTQEHFDISLPISNISHYFWTTDGNSFGFLSRDKTSVFVVSTITGVTSESSLSVKASTCLQKYFDDRGAPENKYILSKMWVYDTSPESETFFCEPPSSWDFPEVDVLPSGFTDPISWSYNRNIYIAKSLIDENYGLPCILNKSGEVIKCLTAIDEKYYQSGLNQFRFSKDNNQIYYVQSDLISRADLCIYDLASNITTCPTEKIAELDGYNIEYYDLSDNELFFRVLYGSSCGTCDFWGEPSSFVLQRDGKDILFMGNELKEPNTSWPYPFFSSLFRPNP